MKGITIWTREYGFVFVPRPWAKMCCGLMTAFALGIIGGYALSAYQHGVDHEGIAEDRRQMRVFMADYQERFAKSLKTTKMQAAVWSAQREQEREQP